MNFNLTQKQIDNKISVLNYNEFSVIAPASSRTYVFEPAVDDIPSLNPMPYSDIEYINSQSNAFRTGLLFFKEDQQEEIYNELKISNWKEILTNKEIENILLNPTMEGLQRIIDIKDNTTFERVRGILVKIKNSNSYDLSNRVINIIEARHKEFQHRILKSQIVLRSKDVMPTKIETEEVKSLKNQLIEMKKMMTELMQSKNTKAQEKESQDNDGKANLTKKKGKPSTDK
jgi:hypothetical protein